MEYKLAARRRACGLAVRPLLLTRALVSPSTVRRTRRPLAVCPCELTVNGRAYSIFGLFRSDRLLCGATEIIVGIGLYRHLALQSTYDIHKAANFLEKVEQV
jgi:hypothetical protein